MKIVAVLSNVVADIDDATWTSFITTKKPPMRP